MSFANDTVMFYEHSNKSDLKSQTEMDFRKINFEFNTIFLQ